MEESDEELVEYNCWLLALATCFDALPIYFASSHKYQLMKHFYFSVLFLILSLSAYSQDEVIKQDNYSASNGITYSVRDHFILGEGSAANGEFRYVSFLGWDDVLFPQGEITEFNLEASSAGAEVKLKKIKKFYSSGSTEVIFKIGIGSLVNYFINIEKAIASCEIEKCKSLDERVGIAFEEPVSENEDHKDLEIIHAEKLMRNLQKR